jgi:hypothetical protein
MMKPFVILMGVIALGLFLYDHLGAIDTPLPNITPAANGPGTLSAIAEQSPSNTNSPPPPPPATDSDDPYAASQQAIQQVRVAEGRQYVLQQAELAGSAERCKVVPDDEVAGIVGIAIHSVPHPLELEFEARKAAERGYANGDCSYWQNNPQAVAEMRERGQLAVAGP